MRNLARAGAAAILLALVAASALFASDAPKTEAQHPLDVFQYRRGTTFPSQFIGWWRPGKIPYDSNGVYEYCFNPNGYPVFGGADAIEQAAEAWNNAVGTQYFQISRQGDCPGPVPSQAVFEDGDCGDDDGVAEIVIVAYPSALTNACAEVVSNAYWKWDTGEMTAGGDIMLNIGGGNVGGNPGQYTLYEVALHELGHQIGLGHASSDAFTGDPILPCVLPSVMCSEWSGSQGNCLLAETCTGPTVADIAGVWRIYRDQDQDGCRGMEEDWWEHKGFVFVARGSSDTDYHDMGDINHDGKVDSIDLGQEAQHWGIYGVGNVPWPYKDMNLDGRISSIDMGIIAQQQANGVNCRIMPNIPHP